MSRQEALQIRTMRRRALVRARSRREGGLESRASRRGCFCAADPGGFLMGELGDEPVGCISAVSYAGRYGFVGLASFARSFAVADTVAGAVPGGSRALSEHNIGLEGRCPTTELRTARLPPCVPQHSLSRPRGGLRFMLPSSPPVKVSSTPFAPSIARSFPSLETHSSALGSGGRGARVHRSRRRGADGLHGDPEVPSGMEDRAFGR